MTDPCCVQEEPAVSVSEEVDDPALQSCCARDLKEQAYASRLKAQLLACDRSNLRRDIGAKTFDPHLNALHLDQPEPSASDSDLASDGEGDTPTGRTGLICLVLITSSTLLILATDRRVRALEEQEVTGPASQGSPAGRTLPFWQTAS